MLYRRPPLVLSFLVAGCSPPLLDESDTGSRVPVDEGRVFTVSLPVADRPDPAIRGRSVSFLGRERSPEKGRDFFTFRADVPGDSEILIARDFAVLIQVWRPHPTLRRHFHHHHRHSCHHRR